MKRGFVLALICLTAVAASRLDAQPLSRFAEQKAEALLRDKLPCLGCHQFGSEGGRLAPDLASVRTRRSAEYIAAIVRDPQRVRPGTMMPRHPMPRSQEDLIVRYLATRAGTASDEPAGAAAAGAEDRGAPALYARLCAGCHGASGAGDGPNAKFLPLPPAVHRSPATMSLRSDDALFDAIAGGGEIMNRSARMPAFGQVLTRAEIASLVRHIRALCRCSGPAWSRDAGRQ